MTTFIDTDSAKLVLLSTAGTIVVAVLANGVVWIRDLNKVAKRKQLLEEARGRVEFWQSWSKTLAEQRSLEEHEKKLVEQELSRSAHVVTRVFINWPEPASRSIPEFRLYLTTVPLWRRILLLYTQKNERTKRARNYLWLLFLFICLLSLLNIYRATHRSDPFIPYQAAPFGPPGVPPPDGVGGWIMTQDQERQDDWIFTSAFVIAFLFGRVFLLADETKWLNSESEVPALPGPGS
jgi:hypothetical protein